MEIGSIVRFIPGLYPDEEGAIYRVIEDNGNRVFIKFICDLNFPPISVARTQDLEIVEEPDARQTP